MIIFVNKNGENPQWPDPARAGVPFAISRSDGVEVAPLFKSQVSQL
jgi:hypothetical protein